MAQINDPFHIQLRKAMIDQNMKCKDLAKRIRRHPSIVTLALKGKAPLAQKKIARILKIDVA